MEVSEENAGHCRPQHGAVPFGSYSLWPPLSWLLLCSLVLSALAHHFYETLSNMLPAHVQLLLPNIMWVTFTRIMPSFIVLYYVNIPQFIHFLIASLPYVKGMWVEGPRNTNQVTSHGKSCLCSLSAGNADKRRPYLLSVCLLCMGNALRMGIQQQRHSNECGWDSKSHTGAETAKVISRMWNTRHGEKRSRPGDQTERLGDREMEGWGAVGQNCTEPRTCCQCPSIWLSHIHRTGLVLC